MVAPDVPGTRAEEVAEPLDDDLALALDLVDGPRERLAGEPGDDRHPRLAAAGDAEGVAEVGERDGLVVADDHEGAGHVVHRRVRERHGLEDAGDAARRTARCRSAPRGSAPRRG